MARHRKRFPYAIPAREQRRIDRHKSDLHKSQSPEFLRVVSDLNNTNPDVQLGAIKKLNPHVSEVVRIFPRLIPLLRSEQEEIRKAADASIRRLMPTWLRWHLYEYEEPSTAIAAIKQAQFFCPLPVAVIAVLQRIANDYSVYYPIRSAAVKLLDLCDNGNRFASMQDERNSPVEGYFGSLLTEASRPKPNSPKKRYTRRHPEPSLYPRPFPDQQASALGIRIEEFSQQELRFFDSNTSDLLLVWNRSTFQSRPTFVESGEMETLGLQQALAQAKARLQTERVGIGKRVVLLNITDGGTETYKITGSHIVASPEEDSLQFNSPLGSQIVGLTEGTEITAKVPKGEIRYLIQKIS